VSTPILRSPLRIVRPCVAGKLPLALPQHFAIDQPSLEFEGRANSDDEELVEMPARLTAMRCADFSGEMVSRYLLVCKSRYWADG
jgi:hypothetical protein